MAGVHRAERDEYSRVEDGDKVWVEWRLFIYSAFYLKTLKYICLLAKD